MVVEAVIFEPVSRVKFPGSRELAGNFPGFWPERAFGPKFTSMISHLPANSLRIGAGNFWRAAGNFGAEQGIEALKRLCWLRAFAVGHHRPEQGRRL